MTLLERHERAASAELHRGDLSGAVPRPRRTTGAATVAEMVLTAARTYGGTALRFRDGEHWRGVSYADLGEKVIGVAAGLVAHGIAPGDRVAILSRTRPEWTYADLGALCAGATVVPIYETSSPEQAEFVLAHSGARLVFCEDRREVDLVRGLTETDVEKVVSFEPTAGAAHLTELVARGRRTDRDEVHARAAAVAPDDPCTIAYTSGTTGEPKGAVLTHRNCRAHSDMCAAAVDLGDGATVFVFLPLAHSMTRMVSMFTLDQGHTLAYWSRDPDRLLEDVQESQPTDFPSVPRLLEKVYTAATSASGARRRLLEWAVERGARVRSAHRTGRRPGPLLRAQHALADWLVLARVRQLFGGRLRMIFSGGAPIAPEILEFFDACGLAVLEGYGLTETGAAVAMNTRSAVRFGTVGRPLPGSEVAIAGDGEIRVRGPHVFAGYYRDPDATAEAIRSGWLATGDIGAFDDDGFLAITGRKKDLIVTAGGKNVAPARIEQALCQAPSIGQAVVVGDRRPYLAALVTIDPERVAELAARAGVDGAAGAELSDHPAVVEAVGSAIEEANLRFAPPERVRRFKLLPRELSQEDGELTPTLKVKRAAVLARYAAEVEQLYAR
jgi:long-chain acyl-CoA synthetase